MARRSTITTRDGLARRLGKESREFGIAVAARAALRVVPLWFSALAESAIKGQSQSEIVALNLFRCAAISRLSAILHSKDLFAAAKSAAIAANKSATIAARRTVAGRALARTVSGAAAPAAMAASLASRTAGFFGVAVPAANAASSAANAASNAGAESRAAEYHALEQAWRAISNDVTVLGAFPFEIAARHPLWVEVTAGRSGVSSMQTEAPAWAMDEWKHGKHLARDKQWHVWTEWYEAVLNGLDPWGLPRELGDQITREFVTWPEEKWGRAPAEINAEIAEIIEKARTELALPRETDEKSGDLQDMPPVEALPPQVSGGYRFEDSQEGPLGLVPSEERSDFLSGGADRQNDYDDIRDKARMAYDEGRNRCGHVFGTLERIIDLPASVADVRAQAFWSRINTLRIKLAGHQAAVMIEERTGERDERKVDPIVADLLLDLVETVNVFVLGDPGLLERDAARPGPQEQRQVAEQASIIAPAALAAAADRSITTPEAGEALEEGVRSAQNAVDTLNDRQAAESGGKSLRNFIGALLAKAYRPIRAVAKGSQNEAAFAWKGVREGAYRAVGGAIVFSETLGATSLTSSAISFVVEHSLALKAYAGKAFSNPQVIEIINWIVRLFG